MRAVVCERLGDPLKEGGDGPLVLRDDHPRPVCGPRGVRISVQSASMNFADMLTIQGLYQEKPKLPYVPGAEVFGIVTEVGCKVQGVCPGDEVVAVPGSGGFADECVADVGTVFRIPERGDASLAGLPVAYGTAHMSLVVRANLRPGETVLVLGAAGGVGLAAVQVAHVVGAVVVAIARGQDKVQVLQDEGADVVIDSSNHTTVASLVGAIKGAAPKGVNVIVDPVGGSHFDASLKCAAWGARVVPLGFASGKIPKVPANIALVKNLTMHGVYWGSYMARDPRTLRESMQQLIDWWMQGKFRVHVSHRVPLHRFVEGFKALASRQAKGKVIVMVKPSPRL